MSRANGGNTDSRPSTVISTGEMAVVLGALTVVVADMTAPIGRWDERRRFAGTGGGLRGLQGRVPVRLRL
ncbi:hypothetical protein GCM10022226_19970 [Sphaerisporangium flaviroseum]|uniref:Uncharacterized protein n=1 Tax=Sphaerisporangium flaviroseum TaxID=509199 RepID=A0ABP7HSH4_9ACTN